MNLAPVIDRWRPWLEDTGYVKDAKNNFGKCLVEAQEFFPELHKPLDIFLRTDDQDAQVIVLAQFIAHMHGEPGISRERSAQGEEAREWFVELYETENETDDGQTAGKNGSKQAGDKWVSPGRLVCTWPDLDLTARSVLFVMAAHGRDDGTNCYVSQPRIADYLGFSSTEPVRRAWRRLEEAGAITKTAEARQQKPPTYRINRGSRTV